jgi:hypothetical protein
MHRREAKRREPRLGQTLQDFFIIGKSSGLVLREQAGAIDIDVEDSAASADEFRPNAGLRFDRGRQTGGPGKVVSARAVRDPNFHVASLRAEHSISLMGDASETGRARPCGHLRELR